MDLVFVSGVSSGIGAALKDHLQGQVTVAGFARSTIDLPHSLAVDLAKPASWPKVIDWMNQVITEVAPAEMGFFHCAATLDPLGFAGSVDSGGTPTTSYSIVPVLKCWVQVSLGWHVNWAYRPPSC